MGDPIILHPGDLAVVPEDHYLKVLNTTTGALLWRSTQVGADNLGMSCAVHAPPVDYPRMLQACIL